MMTSPVRLDACPHRLLAAPRGGSHEVAHHPGPPLWVVQGQCDAHGARAVATATATPLGHCGGARARPRPDSVGHPPSRGAGAASDDARSRRAVATGTVTVPAADRPHHSRCAAGVRHSFADSDAVTDPARDDGTVERDTGGYVAATAHLACVCVAFADDGEFGTGYSLRGRSRPAHRNEGPAATLLGSRRRQGEKYAGLRILR